MLFADVRPCPHHNRADDDLDQISTSRLDFNKTRTCLIAWAYRALAQRLPFPGEQLRRMDTNAAGYRRNIGARLERFVSVALIPRC